MPVVDAGADQDEYQDDSVRIRFSFTASDSAGGWSYVTAWGDGSSDSGVATQGRPDTLAHRYSSDGTFSAVVRVHTAPGEEAQVDFGSAGSLLDPIGSRPRPRSTRALR